MLYVPIRINTCCATNVRGIQDWLTFRMRLFYNSKRHVYYTHVTSRYGNNYIHGKWSVIYKAYGYKQ